MIIFIVHLTIKKKRIVLIIFYIVIIKNATKLLQVLVTGHKCDNNTFCFHGQIFK